MTFGRRTVDQFCEGIGLLIDRVAVHSGRGEVARKKGSAVHIEELEADDAFHSDRPNQQRWLLTTCIAGIAGSLIVGSALLGILGQNAASTGALASVQPLDPKSPGSTKADMGSDILQQVSLQPARPVSVAYQPDKDAVVSVIPQRSLYGDNNYPEISPGSLPYGDGKTVVLDGEFDVTAVDSQNITTITKTPPPEPVDEAIVLGPSRTLVDEITERGVTKEAAQALVQELSTVFPATQMAAGNPLRTYPRQTAGLLWPGRHLPGSIVFQSRTARDNHRRSRRRRHVQRAYRRGKGRHAFALCPGGSFPHQVARRLEPLWYRQGQQGSRIHHHAS